MMRSGTLAIAGWLILALVASGYGVEMKPTPIQTDLSQALLYGGVGGTDDFSLRDNGRAANSSQPKHYSLARGLLYSALVPGLGEYYTGHRDKAKLFFGAEALTWVSFFAFRSYGSWLKNDMYDFAAEKANAQLEGKSDDFLDMVGFYTDIYQYNTLGRVWDPERPYLEDTPENHWLWVSAEDQQTYRDLKNSSRGAYRRSNFMLGIAIASRVISMIDTARDIRRANRRIDDSLSKNEPTKYRLVIDPMSNTRQVTLLVYTPF